MLALNHVLTVFHAIAGGVLTGAAIHNGVLAYRSLRGRSGVAPRLRRLYPRVIGVTWILVMTLGLLIYPSFRVDVRGGFLDVGAPWAVWLFELKEHGVGLGLMLLVYLIPVSGRMVDRGRGAVDLRFYDLASLALGLVVCWATVVGLLVSTLRPL
ncbi:MAG: hypothetical protein VYE15_05635 [Myxococcota bacterium]|nr:hypothetical protein [Myxococcota bacterium]